MYYKIENKESEVYKKLHKMRTSELQMEKENEILLKEKIGLEWDDSIGYHGQQTFRRVTEYSGFKFKEPEKVNLKIWKSHKEYTDFYVPNRKTKEGREMDRFLSNGLKGGYFDDVYDNLNIEHSHGRFTLPYVQICDKDDIIVIFLDDKHEEIKDENVIEITSKEAKTLLNYNKEKEN